MSDLNRKVIGFKLHHKDYAISVQQIKSIERIQPITRVPKTPDYVKGVINLKGVVTPVIDLRIRFGLEEVASTNDSRMIIVFLDDMEAAFIVDAANDVLDIPENAIGPAPEMADGADADYIEGVAKVDGRLLILLHLRNVLETDDVKALNAVEENE